nr:MAG TPA: hypothetical protein [Caudoviricetes sp.]
MIILSIKHNAPIIDCFIKGLLLQNQLQKAAMTTLVTFFGNTNLNNT